METKRLEYIDAARGLTMFLVVAQHITSYWGGLSNYNPSVLDHVLRTFRMPLFFFISGFIAFKNPVFWDNSFFKQRLVTKARVQLLPAIIFSILFALCFDEDPLGFLHHGFRYFWFTPVLFGIFCIYYPCCYLLRNHPRILDWTLIALAIGTTISSFFILKNLPDQNKNHLLATIFYYFEFFVAGHLVRKHEKQAFSILNNDWVNFTVIFLFITSLLVILPGTGLTTNKIPPFFHKILHERVIRYAGLFIVFSFFVRKRDYFAHGGRLSKTMQYIGRHTLDIYLLHNFFLKMSIPAIRTLVVAASSNVVTQILVVSPFATIVISLCLLISSILRNSNFLAYLLFGSKRSDEIKA